MTLQRVFSAGGPAHSGTLRAERLRRPTRQRPGVRRPSAAFGQAS